MSLWPGFFGKRNWALATAAVALTTLALYFLPRPNPSAEKDAPAEFQTKSVDDYHGAPLGVAAKSLPRPEKFTDPQTKAGYFKQMAEYALANGQAAVPFLKQYLLHPDWQYRCAALRALAATGSIEAIAILQSYVSEDHSIEEAAQAAIALGDLPNPGITAFLLEKYRTISDPELRSCLIDTLASRTYEETGAFFQECLVSPSTDAESKAQIIKALGFHQTAPLEVLLPHIFDSDPVVREGAYAALAYREGQNHGQMLLARLPSENDTGVRQSLYGALGAQQDISAAQLRDLAARETASAPRIRAQQAWASAVAKSSRQEDIRQFEEAAIPELVSQALQNPDPGEQRAALQALAMSRTRGAANALQEIAQTTKSRRLSALADQFSQAIAEK